MYSTYWVNRKPPDTSWHIPVDLHPDTSDTSWHIILTHLDIILYYCIKLVHTSQLKWHTLTRPERPDTSWHMNNPDICSYILEFHTGTCTVMYCIVIVGTLCMQPHCLISATRLSDHTYRYWEGNLIRIRSNSYVYCTSLKYLCR